MSHILIPRTPSMNLLRPFIECPTSELDQAWAAMVRIAEVQHARAGSQCLAQIEEPAQAVAEICSASHDDAQFGERAIKPLCDISSFEYGTPLYAGAAPAAVAPQGVTAWMHPETRDVISDAKKHEMSTQYGTETRRKAEGYSVAMAPVEQSAAAPALEAPPAVTGRTAPRNDDERAAAQFFADNPGAALLAWPLYLARDKSLTLEAPAAPSEADIASAREHIADVHNATQMRSALSQLRPEVVVELVARGLVPSIYAPMAAAPQAPAAPADAEMLAALQAVAADVVHVGAGENTISDAARAKVEAVLEKIGAPWPGPATAPAAPAVDALAPVQALLDVHAALLDTNPYAYFELAYTRQTGWMAWITDKPFHGPVINPDRNVLARGQGGTAAEACSAAAQAAAKGEQP